MRITDLLSKESIKLNLSSKTKPEVIDEMVDLVNAKIGRASCRERV